MKDKLKALVLAAAIAAAPVTAVAGVAPVAQAESAAAYYCYKGNQVRLSYSWVTAALWVAQGWRC